MVVTLTQEMEPLARLLAAQLILAASAGLTSSTSKAGVASVAAPVNRLSVIRKLPAAMWSWPWLRATRVNSTVSPTDAIGLLPPLAGMLVVTVLLVMATSARGSTSTRALSLITLPPDRSFRNALVESSVAVLFSWPVGAPSGRDNVAVTTMVAPAGTLLKLQVCS